VKPELATRLESDIDDALGRGELGRAEGLARQYRAAADGPLTFRAGWLSA
jgi:hypothetical protein